MEIDRIEIHGLDEMRCELMDHLMETCINDSRAIQLRTLSRNYRMPPLSTPGLGK